MEKWTNEDIEYFEKVIDAVSRGFVVSGARLTELYNKIFNKHLTVTNCQTCLRGRYNQLKKDFDVFMFHLQQEGVTMVDDEPKEEIILESAIKKIAKKRGRKKSE